MGSEFKEVGKGEKKKEKLSVCVSERESKTKQKLKLPFLPPYSSVVTYQMKNRSAETQQLFSLLTHTC